MKAEVEVCTCCGLEAPVVAGPVDPYGASSASCWAMFAGILPEDASALVVDTYMAQHPGLSTDAGRRSVIVHLVGLWWALERGIPPHRRVRMLGLVFPDKRTPPPVLHPVPDLCGIHVGHLAEATPHARVAQAEAWAWFVWRAWRESHPTVIRLGEAALRREGERALRV